MNVEYNERLQAPQTEIPTQLELDWQKFYSNSIKLSNVMLMCRNSTA